MLEIVTVIALLGGLVLAGLALAFLGFFLKLAFKVVLLPFWLLGVVLKAALLVVGIGLAIVLVPLLVVGLLVLAPLALIGGLLGLGASALA